nr:MAG TPA: minor tail protein [Caudoviricetes sp.]
MARQGDVEVRVLDNFTSSFNSTISTLTNGTAAASRAWKGVEKAGQSISNLGAKLTTGVTLPLAAVGATSFKSFGEVDKTLRLVSETMGSTAEEAKVLESAIKTAASNSTFGMQDAADASLNFARQGFDAAQAADMISPAMSLAAGTASDLSMVTGGLGNTLKAFGADASEASHYTDMMAKAQAQANTDVQGLFDAMSIAGSTANTVGWSFSDLAVLTGVFGDYSIGASEGATALNTGLMRLASPAKEASLWLDELGINVFDANGSLKSMPETIAELQSGFTGLSDQQQLAAASAIFGKNQAAKWVTLINGPGIEALQGYKDSIEGATGASQAMADALMSGPGGAVEKLKSSFDVFKYSAGEALAGAVVPFIEKITDLLDKFNKMDPEQQKQIVKWAMMAAAIGPALLIFGNTVTMVGKVGGAFTNLSRFASLATKGFKGLTAGSSALRVGIAAISTPAGIVIAVIAAIVVVVVAVVTHFNAFKAAMNAASPTMQKLKVSFEEIKSKIEPFIPILLQVGKVVWDVLGNGIAMAAGIAVSAFVGMLSGITGIISGIITAIQGIITFIKGVFTGDWQMAWDGITQIFKGWVQGITGFIDSIKGAIGGILDGIKGAADFVAGGGGSPSKTTVPAKATGDLNWMGGLVQVSEKGGEIIDLPHGTRIYPHDESVRMAKGAGGTVLNIPKLADQIIIREDADIDRIGDAIAKKIMASKSNRGGMSFSANMA